MGFWFIRICFTVIGRLGITKRNACKEVSCFLVDVLFGNISENFQMSTYIIWVVRILWRDAPTVVLMLLLLLLWWLVLTYLLSLVRTVAVVLYVEIVMDLDPLVFFYKLFPCICFIFTTLPGGTVSIPFVCSIFDSFRTISVGISLFSDMFVLYIWSISKPFKRYSIEVHQSLLMYMWHIYNRYYPVLSAFQIL